MIRLITIYFIIAFWSLPMMGQEVWNLEKCIYHAMENNIDIRQSQLNIDQANINQKEANHSRYPNFNAGTSVGLNFGRTIDPTNNSFDSQSFISNNISFNTGMTLYNAGRISKTIKQSKINQKSATYNAQQMERDVVLLVTNAYLSVLFSKENLKTSIQQHELTKEQHKQIESLIKAGVRPANDILEIEAQLVNNEQNIITQQNNITIAMLNLKQLLFLEPSYEMELESPSDVQILTTADDITFDQIYQSALESQPNIKAAELDLQSAQIGEQIAKTSLYPNLSLGGSIGSNYSSIAQMFTGTEFIDIPYFDQVDQNLSYGLIMRLDIPIYNNYKFKSAVEKAKLNSIISGLQIERQKNALKTDVQQALADALTAHKSYKAAIKSRDAQKASYENATKQYKLGGINNFDYVNVRNLLDSAENNLIIAKYDYVFKTKVVDFYLGKPITLD